MLSSSGCLDIHKYLFKIWQRTTYSLLSAQPENYYVELSNVLYTTQSALINSISPSLSPLLAQSSLRSRSTQISRSSLRDFIWFSVIGCFDLTTSICLSAHYSGIDVQLITYIFQVVTDIRPDVIHQQSKQCTYSAFLEEFHPYHVIIGKDLDVFTHFHILSCWCSRHRPFIPLGLL